MISFVLVSCDEIASIKDPFSFAKENKMELQHVLNHYPKGSEKYNAALYLIENMKEHASFSYPESYLLLLSETRLSMLKDTASSKQIDFLKMINIDDFEKVYDAQVITADYLIENIDLAYESWKNNEWSKSFSFDDFCQYILPYRIKDEPLSNWRKVYQDFYRPVFDSIYRKENNIVACIEQFNLYLRDHGWKYDNTISVPHIDATELFHKRVGDCEDMCDMAVYILRALAIPVVTDTYLRSPNMIYSHYWNSVKDEQGKWQPFFIFEDNLPPIGAYDGRKKGKVYRSLYANDNPKAFQLQGPDLIPGRISDCLLQDVTSLYFPENTVTVEFGFENEPFDLEWGYLGVFSIEGWVPIDGAKIENSKAVFQNLENDLVYIPLCANRGEVRLGGYPFILENDTCKYLKPEYTGSDVALVRKYPLLYKGFLEASNSAGFDEIDTLLMFPKVAKRGMNRIELPTNTKYRYIRFKSDPFFQSDMAELYFYGTNGEKLNGELISKNASSDTRKNYNLSNLCDQDLSSYVKCTGYCDWFGFDMGEEKIIQYVEYAHRNDDNFIRDGDDYELFFLSEYGWTSLGQKTGNADTLIYRSAPSNALFRLRNKTRGVEEQIFIVENGSQIFM